MFPCCLRWAWGPRLKTLWALPGICVLALPWYLRNWAIAGSPIYPATLQDCGDDDRARGVHAGSDEQLRISHDELRALFPAMAGHAPWRAALAVLDPFALLGNRLNPDAPPRLAGGYVLAVPVLMIPLYWFGLPINIDSRFFLPAVAVLTVPLAFAFGTNEKWNACVQGLYLAGMLWILVGMNAVIRASVPWYMGGWLSLRGLVNVRSFVLFAGLAAFAAISWRITARAPDRRIPIMVGVAALSSAGVAIGSDVWCAPYRCELLQLSSPFIRSTVLNGWDWVTHNTGMSRSRMREQPALSVVRRAVEELASLREYRSPPELALPRLHPRPEPAGRRAAIVSLGAQLRTS